MLSFLVWPTLRRDFFNQGIEFVSQGWLSFTACPKAPWAWWTDGQTEKHIDITSLCGTVTSSKTLSVLNFVFAWQPWLYPSFIFLPERKRHSGSHQHRRGSDLFTVTIHKDEKQTGHRHALARKPDLPQRAHITVYSAWVHHNLAARVRVNTFRIL